MPGLTPADMAELKVRFSVLVGKATGSFKPAAITLVNRLLLAVYLGQTLQAGGITAEVMSELLHWLYLASDEEVTELTTLLKQACAINQ